MKIWLSPESFHLTALTLLNYRWRLLVWSVFSFVLFAVLQIQIMLSTPTFLVWVALFILFMAIQLLVIASFIFFFQKLPSTYANNNYWFKLYRCIEWCETLLFFFLLPLPTLIFLYALIKIY